MEFKGTKGKWELYNRKDDLAIMASNGFYCVCKSSSNNHVDKANALLISKAPEMLEMLQKIVSNWKFGNQENFIMADAIYNAEQLIKEATEL